MNQCIIEGCPNEAELIAKSGGRLYFSCKKHKKEVGQIVVSEHTKEELRKVKVIGDILYPNEKTPD